MDYLCRDSFFCGVTEGSIASERLLKMLNVSNDRLVIDHKGIYSVEKFLVARRLMYWQVYLHKTSVAAEQVLIQLLRRAKELAMQGVEIFGSPALRYFLYNEVTRDAFYPGSQAMQMYALLDDTDIQSAMKVWMSHKDTVLSTLATAYTNRRLFKALEVKVTDDRLQVTDELRRRYMEQFGISAHEAEFLFSLHTSSSKAYSAADDQIDILYPDGTIRNIADASDMWSMAALTHKVERNYIYYYK
jgi:HD superfamily phosphohydrolase